MTAKKSNYKLDITSLPDDHFLKMYVDEMMESSGGSREFKTCCGLVCLGAVTNRKVYMRFGFNKRAPLYPNIWMCLVGDSSSSYKSTAINTEARQIMEMGMEANFLSDLFSKEALCKELSENGSQVMINEEVSGLFMDMGAKSSYLRSLDKELCKWYDSPNTYKRTIMKNSFSAHDIFINTLFGTTPESFVDNMSDELLTGGFFARMLIATPTSEMIEIPLSQPEEKDNFGAAKDEDKLVLRLKDIHNVIESMSSIWLRLTENGLSIYNRWWSEKSRQKNGRAVNMIIHRYRIYLLKIAALLYVGSSEFLMDSLDAYHGNKTDVENEKSIFNLASVKKLNITLEIPDKYVILARNLMDEYFIPVSAELYQKVLVASNKIMAKIIRSLSSAEKHTLSRTKLSRMVNCSKDALDDALELLEQEGYLISRSAEEKSKNNLVVHYYTLLHD